MLRITTVVALSALVVTAMPAAAQTASVAPTPGMATAPSPEALAVARRVAARLLPPGIYKQLMSGSMSAVTANMGEALKALPLGQIAQMGGMGVEDAKKLDKVNLEQVMAIYDPHWQERQQLTMRAMFAAMGDFFTTMEPDLREGMAQAYANRFSPLELNDLDRFFATHTGAKYAASATTIMTDPAVMASMKDMMPKLMAQMPSFIEAAQKATAALPPPRKIQGLSAADRVRLAAALGVDETKLHDPKGPL